MGSNSSERFVWIIDYNDMYWKLRGQFFPRNKTLTLMVQTDERDPNYLNGLRKLFQMHAPHVTLIFLTDLVKQYVEDGYVPVRDAGEEPKNISIPSSYNNNHIMFLIENAIAHSVNFRIEHRRKFDCRDCYDLATELKAKF